MLVGSPCPVSTRVHSGRVSSFDLIESMISPKSLEGFGFTGGNQWKWVIFESRSRKLYYDAICVTRHILCAFVGE